MDHYSSLVKLLPEDLECHFFDSIESTNLFLSKRPFSDKVNKLKEKDNMEDFGSHKGMVVFCFLYDVIFRKSAT